MYNCFLVVFIFNFVHIRLKWQISFPNQVRNFHHSLLQYFLVWCQCSIYQSYVTFYHHFLQGDYIYLSITAKTAEHDTSVSSHGHKAFFLQFLSYVHALSDHSTCIYLFLNVWTIKVTMHRDITNVVISVKNCFAF